MQIEPWLALFFFFFFSILCVKQRDKINNIGNIDNMDIKSGVIFTIGVSHSKTEVVQQSNKRRPKLLSRLDVISTPHSSMLCLCTLRH